METQHLISNKIDSNTNFVFLKRPKKFLIFDHLYIDIFNHFYSLSKKDFTNYISENFTNSNPKKIYSDLMELSQTEEIENDKTEEKFIIPQKKF